MLKGGGEAASRFCTVAMIVITVVSYGAGAAYGATLGSVRRKRGGVPRSSRNDNVAGGLLLNAVDALWRIPNLAVSIAKRMSAQYLLGWNSPTNHHAAEP